MLTTTDDLGALDDFWEASSLDDQRRTAFAAQAAAYDPPPVGVHRLTPPTAPLALRPVRDRVQRLFATRRSSRAFAGPALRHRHVERILAAVGPTPDGRRTVPEAGALDAVHAYAVVRQARGPLAGRVVRYDHRSHAVHDIAPVPGDDELRALFQFEGESLPHLVVALVVDPVAVTTKYGARGGRFALAQVGHAAQNVGLRLAADRLSGYVLGGGLDREVLTLLGVAHTGVRYGMALACGR